MAKYAAIRPVHYKDEDHDSEADKQSTKYEEIITSVAGLENYINYLLECKGTLDKQLFFKNISCKLGLLRPISALLVPEGYVFPRSSHKPKYLAYFQDSPQVRSCLGKNLREIILNFEAGVKGFVLRPRKAELSRTTTQDQPIVREIRRWERAELTQ